MKYHFIHAALATVLLLGATQSLADEHKTEASGATTAQEPKAGQQNADEHKGKTAKRKAAAKIKLVDVNNASKAQLKKLPGIGDAEAEKIIAGRPYGSKSWLLSHGIIPEGAYRTIQARIMVKLPYKDGAKNVEYLKQAEEKKKAAAKKASDKEAADKKK